MTWFTETAWPPIILLGVIAVILLATWYQRRQARYLGAVVLLAILAVAVWFIEKAIVTPRERVEASVIGIVSAFQRGEGERTLSYVSEQAWALRGLIVYGVDKVHVHDDLRLTDLQIKMSSEDTRASATFRVNATVTLPEWNYERFEPTRWNANWQLERGQWKMFEIHEIDPISGEEMPRLSMIPRNNR